MIFTIGHSSLHHKKFLELCHTFRISHLIDIRTHPRSKWSHYNASALADPQGWLATEGIGYRSAPDLAGWRAGDWMNPEYTPMTLEGVDLLVHDSDTYPKRELSKPVRPPRKFSELANVGLYDFAWYTTTDRFQKAAVSLIGSDRQAEELGDSTYRPALLCCEYDWRKCHRAIIGDYLFAYGCEIVHLQPAVQMLDPTLHYDRGLRYPDEVRKFGLSEDERY